MRPSFNNTGLLNCSLSNGFNNNKPLPILVTKNITASNNNNEMIEELAATIKELRSEMDYYRTELYKTKMQSSNELKIITAEVSAISKDTKLNRFEIEDLKKQSI